MTTNAAGIGHNQPPEATGVERFLQRFVELQATCSAWLNQCPKLETHEQADALGGFKKQLLALGKEADASRKAEQKPHDEAIAAIRSVYRPITDGCERMLGVIEPRLTKWLQEEKDAQRKRQEEAEAEARRVQEAARAAAAEAERKMKAAESGGLVGSSANTMAAINRAAELEREAKEAAKAAKAAAREKVGVGGGYTQAGVKRTITLRRRATYEVSDIKKAAAALARIDAPELREACVMAARRLHRAATRDKPDAEFSIPGITIGYEETAT